MNRKISVPVGTLEVTTSLSKAYKRDSREFAGGNGIQFLAPGRKIVLRAIDGIVIATGERRMAVTNTQDQNVIRDVVSKFKRYHVFAGDIDMFIQFPTPGTEEMLVRQARRAGIRSVWVMHAVGDAPSHERNQKYVMVKRSV